MTQPYRIIDLSSFSLPLKGTELIEISDGGNGSFKLPLATALPGTAYYVSPTGNDGAGGTTPSNPIQTIAKVNSLNLLPGDAVLFQAGQTFSGAILCPTSGTAANPIIFGSYGGSGTSSQATISSGASNGFDSNSQSGIVVRDLIFSGSSGQNTGVALNNFAHSPYGVSVAAINCTISGYGLGGINVNGYNDVLLQQCTASGCCVTAPSDHSGTNAIAIEACTNVRVLDCIAHDNPGTTDLNSTGVGFLVDAVTNGFVSNCQAYNNGTSANATSHSGGPSGFLLVTSNYVTLSNCIAHNNTVAVGSDGIDGNGFFFGLGCTNCSFNSCLSYNNWGAGFIIFSTTTTWDSNSVIDCTSVNDGVGGSGASANCNMIISRTGAPTAHLTNLTISGCTFYQSNGNTIGLKIILAGSNTNITGTFTNNKFVFTVNVPFISCDGNPSASVFNLSGNVYSTSGTTSITWNSINYTLLAAWTNASGQEGSYAHFSGNEIAMGPSNKFGFTDSAGVYRLDWNITNSGEWTVGGTSAFVAGYFFSQLGSGGNEGGYYVKLSTDTNSRGLLALDASDLPILAFGAGGASTSDIGLSRIASGVLGVGNGVASGTASGAIRSALSWIGDDVNSGHQAAFGQLQILQGANENTGLVIQQNTIAAWRLGMSANIDSLFIATTDTPSTGFTVKFPVLGGIVVGKAAVATNATNGFLYIPSCAGTPTGVPVTQTGTVPMVYDSTNNKFYIYNSGWKGGTVPGTFS